MSYSQFIGGKEVLLIVRDMRCDPKGTTLYKANKSSPWNEIYTERKKKKLIVWHIFFENISNHLGFCSSLMTPPQDFLIQSKWT